MRISAIARRAALALLLAAPAIASAHPGHPQPDGISQSFIEGLMHPLTGLDHLCAMVVLGIWSAMTARRMWLAPLAFALAMLGGALLGRAGLPLPAVEPMIAVSLLALGLLTATRTQLSGTAGIVMAALFALFHGHAHGTELSESSVAHAYVGGFMLMTVALHCLGIAGGLTLRKSGREAAAAPGSAWSGTPGVPGAFRNWLARALGGSVALYGLTLLAF